jgi:hypothetical protein
MAHPNICERREFVQALLDQGAVINHRSMIAIAERFACTSSAIRADILALTREPGLESAYTSARTRQVVRARDGLICQYCVAEVDFNVSVVEHVIPASRGGVARPYNLVSACQSCNVRKRSAVWVPLNLDRITFGRPVWRQKILQMADPDQPAISSTPKVRRPNRVVRPA